MFMYAYTFLSGSTPPFASLLVSDGAGAGKKVDVHDVPVVLLVRHLGFVHPEGGADDRGDTDVEAGAGESRK